VASLGPSQPSVMQVSAARHHPCRSQRHEFHPAHLARPQGQTAPLKAPFVLEIVEQRQPECSDQLQTIQDERNFILPNTGYLVRFKGADPPAELVFAAKVEFQGDHLVFLRSNGFLAALFVLENIESWSEVKL
jgi:hypothetical protein